MKSFVVLTALRFLERACVDLSAQSAFIKRNNALWVPSELLGMWVGAAPDLVLGPRAETHLSRSSGRRSDLRVHSTLAVSGSWTILHLEEPTPSRLGLLDDLVARSAPEGIRRPRFVPVFPRSMPDEALRAGVALLRASHPDEVCSPIIMNPMSGALVSASSGAKLVSFDG